MNANMCGRNDYRGESSDFKHGQKNPRNHWAKLKSYYPTIPFKEERVFRKNSDQLQREEQLKNGREKKKKQNKKGRKVVFRWDGIVKADYSDWWSLYCLTFFISYFDIRCQVSVQSEKFKGRLSQIRFPNGWWGIGKKWAAFQLFLNWDEFFQLFKKEGHQAFPPTGGKGKKVNFPPKKISPWKI